MRKILIFDTTLRDGEQAPGNSMHASEKLEMSAQLERLGVDVLEAGFAVRRRLRFGKRNRRSQKKSDSLFAVPLQKRRHRRKLRSVEIRPRRSEDTLVSGDKSRSYAI